MSADTLPKLLLEAGSGPDAEAVAFRQKEFGIWREYRWSDYLDTVRHTYFGMRTLGFSSGDRIAMIAENVPEWLYVDLAVQSAGGVMAALFAESLPDEIAFVLNHTGARFIVAGDQEQTDKILDIPDAELEHIIVVDDRGMEDYDDPRLVRFAEILRRGAEADEVEEFVQSVKETSPDDVAALLYTSGTTGDPKGAVLTQRTAVAAGRSIAEVEGLTPDEELISYLPFAWVGERMFSVFYHLVVRYRENFPEESDMTVVLQNWREIQPSFVLAPPRIWEQLTSKVYIGVDNTTRVKRLLFHLLMPVGQRVAEKRLRGESPTLWRRLLRPLADILVYRWIRDDLGLQNARIALTGGAALGPEVMTFFHAIGVNLRNVYGQTESAGIAVIQRKEETRLDSVGRPLPGMEVRLGDNGEIQLRGDLLFDRYLDNPEKTEEAFEDGWLRTGDQGFFLDDGQLGVTDRMKDLCTTIAGDQFSPQLLENKLKFSRFIIGAVVVGDGRPYVGALIEIDYDNVGNWAQRRGIPYTTFTDLALNPSVGELIAEEVATANRTLPKGLQIRSIYLLEKELDPDDEEVTRTTKLKRPVIERKYADEISLLYGDADEAGAGDARPRVVRRQEAPVHG